ncbi:hypothetical protein PIB30_051883 [Stylosanthes scabra]|uniref:Uncharacterized protein n=1 Tax=Stylosanthes scabra TaxID=79078 RepID=A0ABU6ULG4_9FABA|nr:hypothetical protein [Stylosanthes scabra]
MSGLVGLGKRVWRAPDLGEGVTGLGWVTESMHIHVMNECGLENGTMHEVGAMKTNEGKVEIDASAEIMGYGLVIHEAIGQMHWWEDYAEGYWWVRWYRLDAKVVSSGGVWDRVWWVYVVGLGGRTRVWDYIWGTFTRGQSVTWVSEVGARLLRCKVGPQLDVVQAWWGVLARNMVGGSSG